MIIYQTSSSAVPSSPREEQPAVGRGLGAAPGSSRAESGWELEDGRARVWIAGSAGGGGKMHVFVENPPEPQGRRRSLALVRGPACACHS